MFKRLAVPVAATMIAAGIAVPQAVASEKCSIEVVSGTLNWGIKTSFRNYILNERLAKGNWKSEGAVTESGSNKAGNNYQFSFEIDPDRSSIHLEDGKVVSSDIRTKDSSLTFSGHHGALHTVIKSPFVKTSGLDLEAGSGYVGYYVPGKAMTEYRESDRTLENKKEGEGVFAHGKTQGWSLKGETLTAKGESLRYRPQPGTKNGVIDGVDVIFMGIYSAEYNPEIDDLNIELTVKNNCGLKDGRVPDAGKPDSPKDPSLGNFPKIWSIVLGVAGLVATVAVLFQVAMKSGVLRNLPFMNV